MKNKKIKDKNFDELLNLIFKQQHICKNGPPGRPIEIYYDKTTNRTRCFQIFHSFYDAIEITVCPYCGESIQIDNKVTFSDERLQVS